MKITVSVCRKEGRDNYGSEGASCEVSFEVEPDPGMTTEQFVAEVAAQRAYWAAWCRASVDGDLARSRPAAAPAAPPAKERRDWPAADHGEAARRTDGRTGRAPADPGTGDGQADDDAPRTGKALMARLKGYDEENGTDVFKHICAWAKRRKNNELMVNWDKRTVADAWEEAGRKIASYAESDRFQESLN